MATIRALAQSDLAAFRQAVLSTEYARRAASESVAGGDIERGLDEIFFAALRGRTACVFIDGDLACFCGDMRGEVSLWTASGYEGRACAGRALTAICEGARGALWADVAVENVKVQRMLVARGWSLVGVVGDHSYWRLGGAKGG